MIYKATKLIKEEMERQGLKYSIEEMVLVLLFW